MKPSDWLILQKKVRFGDCDSAGVILFHNLLKKFSQSWPKHEKPEKWIVKNKNTNTKK